MKIVEEINGKNILLLQGPMGPFFKKLDHFFRKNAALTHRICFNGGDYYYANKDNITHYRDEKFRWELFLKTFLIKHRIDCLFLYGDCRFYHKKAITIANELDIAVYVFEEGYIRPDFITLEKGGVNAFSNLPRDRKPYIQSDSTEIDLTSNNPIKYSYYRWTFHTIIYYLSMRAMWHRYPFYVHHRNSSVIREMAWGLRNGIRKYIYNYAEEKFNRRFAGDLSKKYFFVPLQTMGDFQICVHSQFDNTENFIQTVMTSFARYADSNALLVFKHHPIDRGRKDYSSTIFRLANHLGIKKRVYAVHDVHLPTCLINALGTITINSTVGIASLFHKTPTMVLGRAFYDIEGLTCRGMSLDKFWRDYIPPERGFFRRFRNYIICHTQLNGSFYGGFPSEFSNNCPSVNMTPQSTGSRFRKIDRTGSHAL